MPDPPAPESLAELGSLFQEHRLRLLAVVQRRLDPALAVRLDAEDILSDAFLRARGKWSKFKAQSALTPFAWLYRIVLDCLMEAWRHANRACRNPLQEMPFPDGSSAQLGLGLVGSGTSPSAAAARQELQQSMQQVLGFLKDMDRQVLWLRHADQLSFAEIGMVLNLTENAVTVRYVRALRRLKDLWQQLHKEDAS
jgi:RNA polymerase sigma-70 factor (ECF subfamily)